MFTRYRELGEAVSAVLGKETRTPPVYAVAVKLAAYHGDGYNASPILIRGKTYVGNVQAFIKLPVLSGGRLEERHVVPASSIRGVFRKTSTAVQLALARSLLEGFTDNEGLVERLVAVAGSHNEREMNHCRGKNKDERGDLYSVEALSSLAEDVAAAAGVDKEELERWLTRVSVGRETGIGGLAPRELRDACEAFYSMLCPLCSLYGSTFYRGALFFDTVVVEDYEASPRTHVAIDRGTLTKIDGSLYTEEPLVPRSGLTIRFTVRGVKPGSPAARLLAATLQVFMAAGIALGGGKSRGYGLLRPVDAVWLVRHPGSLRGYMEPEKGRGLDEFIKRLAPGENISVEKEA